MDFDQSRNDRFARNTRGFADSGRSCSTIRLLLLLVAVAGQRASADEEFPPQLVDFVTGPKNPVYSPLGAGSWEVRIRERGWILRDSGEYFLWYTGYNGTRDGKRQLGLATSHDGIRWRRHADNPIYGAHWVEDMMVVKHAGQFFMFAEGADDEAQLLTSPDGVQWTRKGRLDIRLSSGKPIRPGPFGTPTVWKDDRGWWLFYERGDKAVWLALSSDCSVWRNVQDEPVLKPGPAEHESHLIALNQVIHHGGRYYGYYHGRGELPEWSTNVAVSEDLVHWKKFHGNPLRPVRENKSSGILVHDGQQYRLYTMHDNVHVHFPR